jgi:hypothetical protein
MLNLILLYLVYVFHIFIMSLITIGPIFLKNKNVLLLIILINIFVVTGWYLYGYCFFTDIENALLYKNNHTNHTNHTNNNSEENKSFITIILQKYFPFISDKNLHIILSIIPFLSTFICCIKLYKKNNK